MGSYSNDDDLLLVGDFCHGWLDENVDETTTQRLVPIDGLHVAVSSCSNLHRPSSHCTAVARVSLAVLKGLRLQQGDVAMLVVQDGGSERDEDASFNNGVVVRLELMEEQEEMDLQSEAPSQNNYSICVPPIVVTNMGLNPWRFVQAIEAATACDNNASYSLPFWHLPLEDNETICMRPTTTLRPAQHVLLQPMGRPPVNPLYKPVVVSGGGEHHENNNNNNPNDDQAYIYPSLSGALLQQGMICAVPDPRHENMVLYYRVLQITVTGGNDNTSNVSAAATTTSQTTFELDSSLLPSYVPRLPPIHLQAAMYEGLWSKQSGDSQQQQHPNPTFPPPHPNISDIFNALLHPLPTHNNHGATDVTVAACRILHIQGSNADHDVVACVNAASHLLGYHCLTIRGLAAFAYNQGHTPRVGGGLLDQLHGLQAALDYIQHQRRMEPCVLHLQAIDQELNAVDEPLQQEQQDRFWMKLMDGLRNYEHGSMHDASDSNSPSNNYRFTPSLLVVLSTTAPLKPGPWMERLVFPSIALSTPDDKYIEHLWKVLDCTKRQSEENQLLLSEEDMALLRGRPSNEIRAIRQELEMLMKVESAGDSTEVNQDLLRKVCDTIDAGRRKATSNISKISPVHWEDVGGLEHVRAEIMDAIELPLKHPHLFPSHTGRSGILLFGPPGTGKTLVAKAVATECQLPFLSVKGPELLGSYVGESEANVRHVFASARTAASENLPIAAAILFFDELDSLAPRRGGMDHGGGVMERVVASLLAELDGPGNNGGNGNSTEGRVFVLGATNRPDLLDPSLLRPGRLDRLVYLGIPADQQERARVLASQLRKMKLDGDAMEMASTIVHVLPPRLSGADMSKLSSGAMLNAVHRLCGQAEEERQANSNTRSMDDILEDWGEERCTPVITMNDLLQASHDVSPSVTEEEMLRYEQLREIHTN